jgi:hypothetical protein
MYPSVIKTKYAQEAITYQYSDYPDRADTHVRAMFSLRSGTHVGWYHFYGARCARRPVPNFNQPSLRVVPLRDAKLPRLSAAKKTAIGGLSMLHHTMQPRVRVFYHIIGIFKFMEYWDVMHPCRGIFHKQ